MDLKTKVYNYLQIYCQGKQNAVRGETIARHLDTKWRTIAGTIRLLRKDGILIGSCKASDQRNGYFLPVTDQEAREYLDTYKSELFDMLQIYNQHKRIIKRRLEINQYKVPEIFKYNPQGQLELAIR